MTSELVEWKYVPPLVSYCSNIFESKAISVMKHDVAVKRLCLRYTVTADDIISDEMVGGWSLMDAKIVRSRVLEILKNDTGTIEEADEVATEEDDRVVKSR